MIRITQTFESIQLQCPIKVDIALPYPLVTNTPIKSLVTLHCAFKDGAFFFDSLGIANFVDKFKLAVISPSLNTSNGFLDEESEGFLDFLEYELIPWVNNSFGISKNVKDHYLLGISMGAYGALKWSLKSKELFSSVGLISGVYDFDNYDIKQLKQHRNQYQIYKLIVPKARKSLLNVKDNGSLIKLLSSIEEVPSSNYAIYFGKEDFLSNTQSEFLLKTLKEKNISSTKVCFNGEHDGDFWKLALDSFIKETCNRKENYELSHKHC